MSANPSAVAVLITSTDLFVGKTFVATGLARALRQRGYSVGVMKPIELGWDTRTDGEWPLDADRLRQAAEVDDPVEDVVHFIRNGKNFRGYRMRMLKHQAQHLWHYRKHLGRPHKMISSLTALAKSEQWETLVGRCEAYLRRFGDEVAHDAHRHRGDALEELGPGPSLGLLPMLGEATGL